MYKWCVVLGCTNTSFKTPEKMFFNVPLKADVRKKWFKLMRREDSISPKSRCFCCEDHFDIPTDMENYIRFNMMGGKMYLKPGVLPHKFDFHAKRMATHSSKQRATTVRRKKEEALSSLLVVNDKVEERRPLSPVPPASEACSDATVSVENPISLTTQTETEVVTGKRHFKREKPFLKMHKPAPSLALERSERKRTQKIVFDPSDLEPERKRSKKSPESEKSSSSACKICHEKLNSPNSDGRLRRMSTCEDCGCKAHTSCTIIGDIRSTQWRCEDCKLCFICGRKRSSQGEPLIQCAECSQSCHMKCANLRKVKYPWHCSTCRRIFPDVDIEDTDSSRSNSPFSSPSKRRQRQLSQRQSQKPVKKNVVDEIDEDEKIPDCSDWTIQQVHAYFMLFAPSQDTQVILEHEIDGRVLLLLKRSDVLKRFDLKLGPALKLYALVKRLQERSSDIKLCWP